MGTLADVLAGDAAYQLMLINTRPQEPGRTSDQEPPKQPQWKNNADGSRTLKVSSMEALMQVLPKKSDVKGI